jgi:hypothetical protein
MEDFMANTSSKTGNRELQVADSVEYSSILCCDAALLGRQVVSSVLLYHSDFIFGIK